MIYYLDSSAWLKRYFTESGSGAIERIFSGNGNTLISCRMGMIEVASAIARRASRENIDNQAIENQLAVARRDYSLMVQVESSEALWSSAEKLGIKHRMRAADAVHLAAALLAGPQMGGVTIVTSDLELLVAASAEHIAAIDPAKM